MSDKQKDQSEQETETVAIYGDCPNRGSMLATWKSEHLCFYCLLSPVCHVALATNQVPDLLAVVSRCRSFTSEVPNV